MQTCNCEITPIIRFINSCVFEGQNNVFLDLFKEQLECKGAVAKANKCLKVHGFDGTIQLIDDCRFVFFKE